ncbi:MAG TPA: YHS domain-containing protein, partial [Hyphomicrobiaceae bacterium]|nr:YHS domain-containing protein [Hyphomicrobiaceae bacterium]
MADDKLNAHAHHAHAGHSHEESGVKDPVCGMTVDPATAKHSHTHEGTTYYFCS